MLQKYILLILVRELICSGKIVLRSNNVPFASNNFTGPWVYGKTHLHTLLNSSIVIYCSLENALRIVSNLIETDFSKHTLPELSKRDALHTYGFTAHELALITWGYHIAEEIPKNSFLYKCHSFGCRYINPKERALAILDAIFKDEF